MNPAHPGGRYPYSRRHGAAGGTGRTDMTTAATTSVAAAVLDRLYAAWAAGDADAFVADFTADATSIVPGSVSQGRAALRDRMATLFAGPLNGTRVVDEVQSVRYLGADTAVVISRSAVVPAGATEPDG